MLGAGARYCIFLSFSFCLFFVNATVSRVNHLGEVSTRDQRKTWPFIPCGLNRREPLGLQNPADLLWPTSGTHVGGQVLCGEGRSGRHQVVGRPGEDDPAAVVAGTGAEVDDPVGVRHDGLVVLDHDD